MHRLLLISHRMRLFFLQPQMKPVFETRGRERFAFEAKAASYFCDLPARIPVTDAISSSNHGSDDLFETTQQRAGTVGSQSACVVIQTKLHIRDIGDQAASRGLY